MEHTRLELFVIDPQNDFCHPEGSLSVPGAAADMDRLARLVDRLRGRLDGVHVSLDGHHRMDISQPLWWLDREGRAPAAFTRIEPDAVRAGDFSTADPRSLERSLAYLDALEARGRYPHVIWPYHCLIGDAGQAIWPRLAEALHAWEERFLVPEFVHKGANPWTEHFSAVEAEVPDAEDPATQTNSALVAALEQADTILLAGEALSHCLGNTARDLARHFSRRDSLRKLVLLTDASSPVPGFEREAQELVRELCAQGMRTATTRSVLAAA